MDKDGRITARKCEVYWNGGAYADIGPRVTQKSGFTASGPYDIDNVWIDSYALYTNLPPAGALRGFGIPQLVWAYESHTDMIARALKLDPIEFRRKNILREGRPQATGTLMQDDGLENGARSRRRAAQLECAVRPRHRNAAARPRPRDRHQGGDLARPPRSRSSTSAPTAAPTLYCGTVDMGQGSDTAMAQIVGEVLNVPAESVKVVQRDTDVTPYDMGTLGSRSLFHMGNAVKLAAEDARDKIAALAREVGEPEGSNIPRPPSCSRKDTACRPATSSAREPTSPTTCRPIRQPGLRPMSRRSGWSAASGAEVEVDTETGQVRVTKLVNVVDCGRPINPKIVETQISGASLMQLGFTMFEKMHIDGGQVTNASLADYKIPGILDVPPR